MISPGQLNNFFQLCCLKPNRAKRRTVSWIQTPKRVTKPSTANQSWLDQVCTFNGVEDVHWTQFKQLEWQLSLPAFNLALSGFMAKTFGSVAALYHREQKAVATICPACLSLSTLSLLRWFGYSWNVTRLFVSGHMVFVTNRQIRVAHRKKQWSAHRRDRGQSDEGDRTFTSDVNLDNGSFSAKWAWLWKQKTTSRPWVTLASSKMPFNKYVYGRPWGRC